MNKNLADYLKIYEDVLDKEFCNDLVVKLDKHEWYKHGYYDVHTDTSSSYENDLSITHGVNVPEESKFIMDKIWHTLHKYVTDLNFDWYSSWSGFTEVRYNRYDIGTEMRPHCDHIHSMFDGNRKGIPILTVLGGLNDNYTGGQLIMWEDEIIEIPAGAVAVFPSNFLYPHEVRPVKSGVRYSYVSWAW